MKIYCALRSLTTTILLLAHLIASLNASSSLNWLSIAKTKNINFTDVQLCDRFIGWSPHQRRFCKRHFELVDTLKQAAILTLNECQTQFRARRWNCSTKRLPNLFGRLPESGYREASYLHALSSAALTYAVTSACREGRLNDCGCDESKNGFSSSEGFIWSGCSDNIAYGMAVSEKFLDARVRKRLSLTLLNLFNFETGRQIIERNMLKQCKCHGGISSPSSSSSSSSSSSLAASSLLSWCEFKTCWQSMPAFSVIAAKLKEKYDAAIQVRLKRRTSGAGSNRLVPKNAMMSSFHRLSKTDLVYFNPSPSYCQANLNLASLGTRGRTCSLESRGSDSCASMCCGRPHLTRLEVVTFKCNCTFVWCCEVKCQECSKLQQISKCA